MIKMRARRAVAATCVAALLFPTLPVRADDTKTGVLAGLGFAAASGKTTAADGSGAIEAGILATDAYDQAGAIIASLVSAVAPGRPILVLAHDENPNFNQPDLVLEQIRSVRVRYTLDLLNDGASCRKPSKPKKGKGKVKIFGLDAQALPDDAGPLTLKDLIGAALIDTSISPIDLPANDRMLISSVIMHAGAKAPGTPAVWTAANVPVVVTDNSASEYVVPADATYVPLTGTVYSEYKALVADATTVRARCDTDLAKAVLTDTADLIKSLNTAGDKGELSPLLNAIQLETIRGRNPYILRLSVEQAGGTMLTRTGVIYSVGVPGAAVVSSGLVVSFRLSDPSSGKTKTLGMVRCMTNPLSLKRARELAAGTYKKGGATPNACSYQARRVSA